MPPQDGTPCDAGACRGRFGRAAPGQPRCDWPRAPMVLDIENNHRYRLDCAVADIGRDRGVHLVSTPAINHAQTPTSRKPKNGIFANRMNRIESRQRPALNAIHLNFDIFSSLLQFDDGSTCVIGGRLRRKSFGEASIERLLMLLLGVLFVAVQRQVADNRREEDDNYQDKWKLAHDCS